MFVEGVGRSTRDTTGWTDAVAFVDASPDGSTGGQRNFGAHFNSSRSQVRRSWIISGVTRDKNGNALASCAVSLFSTQGNLTVATTTSDGSGNYSFSVDGNSSARFMISYLPGPPDVAGTTVNTLVPVLV
jgi:hypothetical protein